MDIVFAEGRAPGRKVAGKMKEAAAICVAEKGLNHENVEISVSFVSAGEMRGLNSSHRGIDKVTDVLSFPQYSSPAEVPAAGKALLGDVVICTEQALIQADEFGHSPEREIVYLFVHSVFHLLGHDHEQDDDKDEMRELEEKVMRIVKLGMGHRHE